MLFYTHVSLNSFCYLHVIHNIYRTQSKTYMFKYLPFINQSNKMVKKTVLPSNLDENTFITTWKVSFEFKSSWNMVVWGKISLIAHCPLFPPLISSHTVRCSNIPGYFCSLAKLCHIRSSMNNHLLAIHRA